MNAGRRTPICLNNAPTYAPSGIVGGASVMNTTGPGWHCRYRTLMTTKTWLLFTATDSLGAGSTVRLVLVLKPPHPVSDEVGCLFLREILGEAVAVSSTSL